MHLLLYTMRHYPKLKRPTVLLINVCVWYVHKMIDLGKICVVPSCGYDKRGGVFYNFPRIFQAKLSKNEWNIFKYSKNSYEGEQISLLYTFTAILHILGLYYFRGNPWCMYTLKKQILTPLPPLYTKICICLNHSPTGPL